jgi:hypothetical protein
MAHATHAPVAYRYFVDMLISSVYIKKGKYCLKIEICLKYKIDELTSMGSLAGTCKAI